MAFSSRKEETMEKKCFFVRITQKLKNKKLHTLSWRRQINVNNKKTYFRAFYLLVFCSMFSSLSSIWMLACSDNHKEIIAWNLPRSRRYPYDVPEQQKKKTLSLFSLYVCRLILIPCFNCVCWCRPLVWESIMQSVILSAQRIFSTTIRGFFPLWRRKKEPTTWNVCENKRL